MHLSLQISCDVDIIKVVLPQISCRADSGLTEPSFPSSPRTTPITRNLLNSDHHPPSPLPACLAPSASADDLCFEKGDIIVISAEQNPDWWRRQVLNACRDDFCTIATQSDPNLNVVLEATLLNLPSQSSFPSGIKRFRAKPELENKLFMNCVVASVMAVINDISLDLVTGLVSLLISRNDLMVNARLKAGIVFLTLFISREELLRSVPSLESIDNNQNESTTPSHESLERFYLQIQEQQMENRLLIQETNEIWNRFRKQTCLAIDGCLGCFYLLDGRQTLVGGLRGQVLENVIAASKKSVPDKITALKIVGLLLLW
ncbi:hypothetical protein Pst134EB_021748 [Puccinia striiformis f. sp. tritici]|nr:hypothetical protein Pst134EB_021748 [Puccinia striiformis f. sp. tritici]